ncbi:MAG: SMC-Scp complex subunit ScpB [Candidatus Sungbacteria bacterium]|nr:SMC-Scp complex subunit ScpB [Candidatus Sungbacteria bacterium]
MQTKSIIEALLFMHGEPMKLKELGQLLELSEEEISDGVHQLAHEYTDRGLVLVQKDGAVEIGSHPDAHAYVEKLVKSEFTEGLSRSGLETLAIVAYKGPLSRPEIDYIRGVNSSFTLRNLLMRGLIERIEHPRDARAYQYRISFQFLEHFGLSKLEELPEYESLQKEAIEIAEEKPGTAEIPATQQPAASL